MKFYVLFIFFPFVWDSLAVEVESHAAREEDYTVTPYFDLDNGILIASTLDGSLLAIDQKTGNTKWTLKNEPAVKVLMKHNSLISPIFLPDPKDGSLYLLNVEEKNGLTKLPFSIQQLVADSPTRSQDGIFYFGKKHDSWITIDNITGEKNVLFSTAEFEKVCPAQTPNIFFIGRTEYNLALIDSKRNNNNWNITYYDYSSRPLSIEQLNRYGYIHVAGSASGTVKTFNKKLKLLEWEKDLGSPMVALYLQMGKDIFKLPFSSAAESSLKLLPSDELQQTLFIGEHTFGYYALPSFVDSQVKILTDTLVPSRFLIGGPDDKGFHPGALILGHYKVPSLPKVPLKIAGKSQWSKHIIYSDINNSSDANMVTSEPQGSYISPESKILAGAIAFLAVMASAMFFYLIRQVREIRQSSQGSSNGSSGSYPIYDSQKGIITVGKISFDTQKVLGKGCEGTFVFRGEFDGREVAVKRLLPECFTIADREVQLLRESDSHPNVVRYHSTEQDSQFRYIALELCSATLQDYVEKDIFKDDISYVDLLKQATLGLEHLHTLKIVHRDIKPHNILLARGHRDDEVKAKISDFGLCKKLPHGKNSFSRKSGITGTEGWIAPEMMNNSGRMMSAVDIFSLGCVFYYTISGFHPFGDSLRRQSNILLGEFKMTHLRDELWKALICKMISSNPSDRPSAETVRNHPVFWDKPSILTFLQDVSDRVDKETVDSPVLRELELGGDSLHKGDWKEMIDAEIAEDIGKYRSYRGDSVRDLLRAFRNKKHHYRDLTKAAQKILGPSAESYVDYWTKKFPQLLHHVWSSMQMLRSEPCFAQYYDPHFSFPCEKSEFVPLWIQEMKLWEQSFANKKQRNSPLNKNKQQRNGKNKLLRVSENNSSENVDNDLQAWIHAGEESGAWRPRKLRRESEEKNVTWKLHS